MGTLEGILEEEGEMGMEVGDRDREVTLEGLEEEERREMLQTAVLLQLLEIVVIVVA